MKKAMLQQRIPKAWAQLKRCRLCPRACGVDRTSGETGICNTGDQAVVYGFMPHHGEEPPLSGSGGSGTIFFTHCNLRCCFCQNEDISIRGDGEPANPEQMARAMVRLQDLGCHNINFVTPTHVVPFILKAVDRALDLGLEIPLVYNTSGYDTAETLALLDGIIDIYLPDFKFWDSEVADMVCDAPDYPEVARQALKIMHRQVGDLKVDGQGIARSGLLVRHLVLPDDLAGTQEIVQFLAQKVSSRTAVNIMSQYRPVGNAFANVKLSRPPTVEEYRRAVELARHQGLFLVD
ncbi:MAG: radical SAM protein [Desulfobacter sp.]|nr:MAG: radical SAM protein [Desulfobacter sp.]